jgi:hypothetical protein
METHFVLESNMALRVKAKKLIPKFPILMPPEAIKTQKHCPAKYWAFGNFASMQ